jgi:hypothetical protein
MPDMSEKNQITFTEHGPCIALLDSYGLRAGDALVIRGDHTTVQVLILWIGQLHAAFRVKIYFQGSLTESVERINYDFLSFMPTWQIERENFARRFINNII